MSNVNQTLDSAASLFVATSNDGKLRDFRAAAEILATRIAPLPGLHELPPPAEDGVTFRENARAKAVAYSAARPGMLVVADDSGLEVEALGGAPGVRSARYAEDAGEGAVAEAGTNLDTRTASRLSIDERNRLWLLERLRGADAVAPWTARYRCVLAAARDGVCLLTADGTVEGVILPVPRGAGGFGYDPLFYLPEQGKTMAEIDPETRQLLSHRGRALRALLTKLRQQPAAF
jgi:XTP/dITP diphosphohydrolase